VLWFSLFLSLSLHNTSPSPPPRYTDALLGLPLLGVTAFARQSLAGASYALLTNDDFEPNPDYFAALAYAQITTPVVLAVSASPPAAAASIHVYAQCARGEGAGAIAIAWVNVDADATFAIDVSFSSGGSSRPQPASGSPRPQSQAGAHWQRPQPEAHGQDQGQAGGQDQGYRLEYHFTPASGDDSCSTTRRT
jgi:hypothetical protein